MSVDKYKFISPGIFVSEIDNTGRNATAGTIGPVIIGRSEKGPILKPTRVDSFSQFVDVFGAPIAGGRGGDIVRNGNYTSPTYAAYAAQAWLRNNPTITFVRLGGKQNLDALTTGDGEAGWQTTKTVPAAAATDNGGAFGLFVAERPTATVLTAAITCPTGTMENTHLFLTANGVPATFRTGSTTSTTLASTMSFSASQTAATTATNLAAVISLTSYANATALSNVVTITSNASTGLLGSLNLGTDMAWHSGTAVDNIGTASFTAVSIGGVALVKALTGTMSASYAPATGTLAAVWYIDEGCNIGLSGTNSTSGASDLGLCKYIDSTANQEFKLQISHSSDGVISDSSFNFTPTSDKFIRRIYNTNPILTNSDAVSDTTPYWLGESYEGALKEELGANSTAQLGVIMPLMNLTQDIFGGKTRKTYQDAKTGWFFGQDLNLGSSATGSFVVANQQKLFRLVAQNSGDWAARNLKVSIKDLRASQNDEVDPYGSFSVVIRQISDTDNRISVIEQFNNCNLNPGSANYIGRKIGDMKQTWNDADHRYERFGDYQNRSKYIRVEIDSEVMMGDTDPRYLPWGTEGPMIYNSWKDLTTHTQVADSAVSGNLGSFGETVTTFIEGATNGDIEFGFPTLRLRASASQGTPTDPTSAYYGVDTTFNTSRLNSSVRDHLKIRPSNVANFSDDSADSVSAVSWRFTLDDMCHTGAIANKNFVYRAGSRLSAKDASGNVEGTDLQYLRGSNAYNTVLDNGVDRFTTVFFGGFDGLNIKESEPLRIVNKDGATNSATANYVFNSVQIAIDSLRDKEEVEYDLACMPGIINNSLNQSLIDLCENRGDALAIVDLKGGYVSRYEDTRSSEDRKGSIDTTINNLKDELIINSSYAASYYPWVQIRDQNSGQAIWAPPSIAALGAMSYSQRTSNVWFAPAGFTRGGLSDGRAGLPIVSVRQRLTSKERDRLYEANINPIAQFPAEGIVIFGQKTMQISESALDRINIRRLLIYLKRQISRFAATVLFDQNVQVTWSRFSGQVAPFLRAVQAGMGITDFKLILDETTTTPDLVDRNIVYAKIYIKPARAIEYIAIDFILTDSGAAFED